MSTRERITMTEAERLAFLGEEMTVIVTSFGPRGWPHSMPMWFVVRASEVWMWTYRTSQKVRNLERDPRATLLVETGKTCDQLRGVMIEAEAALAHQASKRVAIGFHPRRVVSWDHRKL
jgi:general stress protein 26